MCRKYDTQKGGIELSKTVKEKRNELGLSQTEVATKSGINYSTYVKKERGTRKWYYEEIKSLCEKVFKCDITEISC